MNIFFIFYLFYVDDKLDVSIECICENFDTFECDKEGGYFE